MKFSYDKESDALYINFVDIPGVDSYEISPNCIVDIDSNGNVIGMEILNVKEKVDFKQMIFDHIPSRNVNFINQPAFS